MTMMGVERWEVVHMLRRTRTQGMGETLPQIIPMTLRDLVGDFVTISFDYDLVAERLLYLKTIRAFIAVGPTVGPPGDVLGLMRSMHSRRRPGQCR
jgi:hypothetical protein